MTMTRQLQFGFFGPQIRVSSLDRMARQVLGRLARGHSEVWHAVETIAARLGVGVRMAQIRLRRLESLGWIQWVRDRSLQSGHRIVLLWRTATTYVETPGANHCASPAQTIAPAEGVPPHPPIEESEDREREEKDDDRGAVTPAPEIDASPASSSSRIPVSAQTQTQSQAQATRKATPEEVERLKAAASKAAPADSSFAGWALGVARQWGLSWALPAVESAARKAASGQLANPRGYVTRTIDTMRREGGPPAITPPPPPAQTREEKIAAAKIAFADYRRREAERWAKYQTTPATPPPPPGTSQETPDGR